MIDILLFYVMSSAAAFGICCLISYFFFEEEMDGLNDLSRQIEMVVEDTIKNLNLERLAKVYPPVKDREEKKKIVVTGGAGFVGSHLVDYLMKEGHLVIVVDNLFTGKQENIEQWMGHPNFTFIRHDITLPIFLEVEEIYHLACPASPPHYQHNPIKTIKTNILGTLNMLGLAHRVGAKILLSSTSEIYGDPLVHPQVETYWGNVNPIGPRSCYDEGKRLAETLMTVYHEENNVDIRIARIFNTFGPRMQPNDGRVVPNFIIQALNNQPLTVYGNGSFTRSFQYVDDLVTGLVLLMDSDYNKPVNLGNPEEYTIKDFAKLILKLTNSASDIVYLDAMRDDPTQRKPDITLAKRELDWQPRISMMDGLRTTINHFKWDMDKRNK